MKLLRQFAEQQGPALDQIADALARGDHALAERLAHTLKGVAGNVGATSVPSAAAVLERAIRDRSNADEVKRAEQQVGSVLGPLVAGIRTALGAAASDASAPVQPAAPTSPARSREAAAQLATLLSDSDAEAVEFVEAHRDALRPLVRRDELGGVRRAVQGYAFADAQAQLERALEATAGSR